MYSLRNRLYGDLEAFASPEEREKISAELQVGFFVGFSCSLFGFCRSLSGAWGSIC